MLQARPPGGPSMPAAAAPGESPRLSALHNKPFPLQGIKILDFRMVSLPPRGGTRFPRGDGRGELQGRMEG